MEDKILMLRINLWFIIKEVEEINYKPVDYDIEAKIKEINQKVYELSGAIEELEVLLDRYGT